MTFLQQMDKAITFVASSIGGLFGAPPANEEMTAQNDEKTCDGNVTEEDKSVLTDRVDADDDTNAVFSMPAELTEKTGKHDGDWLSYMENVIFPTNDAVDVSYFERFMLHHRAFAQAAGVSPD